jgi:hypothetical protein
MQQQAPRDRLLSDDDIQLIAHSAETFPGHWYLDHLIDCRRPSKPRVWVRANELADHQVDAIGFERAIGLVLVTLCRDGEDEREAIPNQVYQALEIALAGIREYLCFRVSIDMARRTRVQRSADREPR